MWHARHGIGNAPQYTLAALSDGLNGNRPVRGTLALGNLARTRAPLFPANGESERFSAPIALRAEAMVAVKSPDQTRQVSDE